MRGKVVTTRRQTLDAERVPLVEDRNVERLIMPPDRPLRATKSPVDSTTPFAGYLGGSTRVSFRRRVSVHNSSSSKRYLTTTVVVLILAIVGSLGAILVRSGAAAQGDASIVDLRRSLP